MQILGKRPDGYHDVRTTLQTISLHDDLHFEHSPARDISLSCDDPQIPKGTENLVLRAAEALRDQYQVSDGARIHLHKSIPTQAGLGGGSSNAAVTLLALKGLWNVAVGMEELAEIASSLGADVPFFLLGGRALATGTGSVVTKLPDEENTQLIVIHPRASVSTADAYQALNSPALTSNNPIPILSSSLEKPNSRNSKLRSLPELKNDFESVIFDMEPEIERAKMSLLAAGAQGALLAGSGSSVFGIFADREAQQRALNEIKVESGWRVFACATVSRIEYARALSL